MRSKFLGRITALAAATVAILSAASAQAAFVETNHQFITNGGFEQTTNGVGELGYSTNLVGWTSLRTNGSTSGGDYGYNFVFSPSTANTGVPSQYGSLELWGPANGANNGFRADPNGGGGNFVGNDGGYNQGYLIQQVTGLIAGQVYHLSFDWAAAQQEGYSGVTHESWYYGMASGALDGQTSTVNNASHGFVDWRSQSYDFVATSATDYVYFLAQGTPTGQPPFSLLDNVSLTGAYGTVVSTAPEPATWAMFLLGFGLIGWVVRRRTPATATPSSSRVPAC